MIVVTGGLGFIGTHVARELVDSGEDVVLTRHRSSDVPPFLAEHVGGRVSIESLDVSDTGRFVELLQRCGATSIVHLATPPRRDVTPAGEMRSAVDGILSVFEASSRAGISRLTIASSLRVYGEPVVPPAREEAALSLESANPIQASKLAEEAIGSYLASAMGVDAVFLRIAIVFGPRYRTLLNVPARLCHLVAGGRTRLSDQSDPLVGHPDDAWDLCYVRDCARAVRLVATAPERTHRTYNVGSGSLTTLASLVESLKTAAPDADLSLSDPERAPLRSGPAMSIDRLHEEFGYLPDWDCKAAMADYLRWLQVHEY